MTAELLAAGISGDFQIQWDGSVFTGLARDGSAFLTGWDDLPDLTAGDADRPSSDGAWPGRVLAGPRTVTARFRARSSAGTMRIDLPALRRKLTRTQDERILMIRTLGETQLCFARLASRIITTDGLYSVGRPLVTVQWKATDPRRYSIAQHQASVGLPQPLVGTAWPFTWPVLWDSSGGGSGQVNCFNAGDTDTPPVIVIPGPVETPSLTNQASGAILEFGLSLAADEALQIDAQAGTATLGGADRAMNITARSVPVPDFLLMPGDNLLAFRSPTTLGGGPARASITWRDASI